MYAALTSTAGNVLSAGGLNAWFLALEARNGRQVDGLDTGSPVADGIIRYERDGKRYVPVAAVRSGGSAPLTGAATIVIVSTR